MFSLIILYSGTAFSADSCPIFKIQLRSKLSGGKTPVIELTDFWSIHSGPMKQLLLMGPRVKKSDQLISYSVGKNGELSKKKIHPLRSDGDSFAGTGLNFNNFVDGSASHKHAEKITIELRRAGKIFCLKDIKLRRGD